MIEPMSQLGGETAARARSAKVGFTLYLANIPRIIWNNHKLVFSKRPDEAFGLEGQSEFYAGVYLL
jgi:hypothetical protein